MIRACDILTQWLEQNVRPTLMWAPVPVLMPGERGTTEWDPGKRSTASAVVTGTDPTAEKKIAINRSPPFVADLTFHIGGLHVSA
jgi:hypothetical protein